jgi:hypothetical protein
MSLQCALLVHENKVSYIVIGNKVSFNGLAVAINQVDLVFFASGGVHLFYSMPIAAL